jgi:general secretion pathway protein I
VKAGHAPTRRRARAARRGFTLLEVLVAIAILGLGLTAILSAQFSAVTATGHARHMNAAVGLARCKMTEVEQQLIETGFPEVELIESGPCCEGDATPNISCSWRVERPTFPDANYGDLDLDTDLDSSALGKLSESANSGDPISTGDIGDVASSLAGEGALGDALAGGVGGIASLVMSMVYPDLKNLFEASARRITVVLTWTEGSRSYDIELTQWVTQPQPGLAADGEEEGAGGGSGTGSGTGQSTGSGSGTGTGRTTTGSQGQPPKPRTPGEMK